MDGPRVRVERGGPAEDEAGEPPLGGRAEGRGVGRPAQRAGNRRRPYGPRIGVEVADPALADALVAALQARLDAAMGEAPAVRVVDDDAVEEGALVRVRAEGRGADALLAHVEAIEAAGAGGIQLVWSGRPRSAESAVFRVLEAWRGRRRRCPLVLAPDDAPAWALRRAMRRRD